MKENQSAKIDENGNNKQVNEKRQNTRMSKGLKLIFLILIIITPVFLITLWSFQSGELQPSQTHMVEMRDGVKLATDIYLPDKDGKIPLILFRTPYGKSEGSGIAKTYLEYDVAFVSQDHRGCYDSEGAYTAFAADGRDSEDTIEWLNTQEWFNGYYATVGGSARGITQYMQVPYLDDVACQYIVVATPDVYDQGLYQGGVPRKMLAENWLNGIEQGDYYYELFDHPLNTDTFAEEHRIDTNEWKNVIWPSIHMGGWYDCFSQGTIDGFMGYQYQGGLGGAGHAKLIIGPWTHGVSNNVAGELTYPDNAASDPNSNRIYEAMFAEKLLNITDFGNYRTMPTVTYYVMGDVDISSENWNRWATADSWPIPYKLQKYYFQEDNTISSNKPSQNHEKTYIYNPANPIETIGGANLMNNNRGPFDQNTIENGRTDVISFEYNVTEDILITGRITAELYIKSNCTDTDFTMKLMDEYPDGRSMLICDGIIRMRYREGRDAERLMDGTHNTIYKAEIDLWSTSYVFAKGHKIRVSISSSNYPRFDLNDNTGEKVDYFRTSDKYYHAKNTIVLSPSHPSSINLPIPENSPSFVT